MSKSCVHVPAHPRVNWCSKQRIFSCRFASIGNTYQLPSWNGSNNMDVFNLHGSSRQTRENGANSAAPVPNLIFSFNFSQRCGFEYRNARPKIASTIAVFFFFVFKWGAFAFTMYVRCWVRAKVQILDFADWTRRSWVVLRKLRIEKSVQIHRLQLRLGSTYKMLSNK